MELDRAISLQDALDYLDSIDYDLFKIVKSYQEGTGISKPRDDNQFKKG